MGCTIGSYILPWRQPSNFRSVIILRRSRIVSFVPDDSGCIRQIPFVPILNITHRMILILVWVVVDEPWVDGSVYGVRSDCYALLLQHNSALPFGVFRILAFGVVHNLSTILLSLLFHRHILNSFDSPFHRHHFDFLFRNYFFVILLDILNCVVICHHHFSWDFLENLSLFVFDDLSLDRDSLHILPLLILCYFFLIGHIRNSTLTWCINSLYLWFSPRP